MFQNVIIFRVFFLNVFFRFKWIRKLECFKFYFLEIFWGSNSLQNINIIRLWNVSKGKDFSKMFSQCIKLSNINAFINLNVSKGKHFSNIFYHYNISYKSQIIMNWNKKIN